MGFECLDDYLDEFSETRVVRFSVVFLAVSVSLCIVVTFIPS